MFLPAHVPALHAHPFCDCEKMRVYFLSKLGKDSLINGPHFLIEHPEIFGTPVEFSEERGRNRKYRNLLANPPRTE